MAKYVHTMPSTRDKSYSREYKSIVAVRKAGLKQIENDYAWPSDILVYEITDKGVYQVGVISWGRFNGTAFYKSNPMGKPRPNSIRPGTWILNKDGTLNTKVARN